MRRVLYSCLAVIFCSVSSFAFSIEVPITVQVQNATTSAVYFQKAHLEASQLSKTHRIDLTNGYAQFIYTVEESGFVEMLYNGYAIPLYIDQSSAPTISFDGQNIFNSIIFTGAGAANNNFIADYYRTLGTSEKVTKECAYLDIYFDRSSDAATSTSDVSAYARSIDETYLRQSSVLSKHKSNIQQIVYDFYISKSKYDKEANKLNWFLVHKDRLNSSEIKAAKLILQPNEKVLTQASQNVDHPAAKNLLKAVSIWKYLPNDIGQYRAYMNIYPLIEQNFYGEAKCYLTSQLLVKVYEKSGESELGRSKISELSQACPQYTDRIMEMYGSDISGVEDIAAVDIDMVDKSGALVSLEDFPGQVIYISFWASWCKPCIEGFKKSKDIRKQLQDLGVVLINVSIDKKEEAWRDAMIRYNPQGINTWAISLQDLSKDYDISAIPLYHIVNKQGKFAYLSADGGRNIVEEFRAIVEQ